MLVTEEVSNKGAEVSARQEKNILDVSVIDVIVSATSTLFNIAQLENKLAKLVIVPS